MTDICIEKYVFLCVSRQLWQRQPTASAVSVSSIGGISRQRQPTASAGRFGSVSCQLRQRQSAACSHPDSLRADSLEAG